MERLEKSKEASIRTVRAGQTKVRTGCITCKVRHIKCDEKRPICDNCAKSLRRCTWTRPSKIRGASNGSHNNPLKLILPQSDRKLLDSNFATASTSVSCFNDQGLWYTGSETEERRRTLSAGCVICRVQPIKCDESNPLCSSYPCRLRHCTWLPSSKRDPGILILPQEMLPGTGFKNENEWHYFRYFNDNLAEALSGLIKTSLWKHYIPQLGELVPYVRNAMIALGALSLSKTINPVSIAVNRYVPTSHELYAVSRYVKSLEGMRKALTEEVDSRQILIACLLVFCFESLQGHQASASIHASGGLEVVSRFIKNPGNKWIMPADKERSTRRTTNMLDEDLCAAYSGLDLHALLFIDTRSSLTHQRFKANINAVVNNMPDNFKDIYEVAEFWQMILRRNCHFIAVAQSKLVELQVSTSLDFKDFETNLRPGNNPWTDPSIKSEDIPNYLYNERDEYILDMAKFQTAVGKILSVHSSLDGGRGFFIAKLLEIQMEMSRINLIYCFFPRSVEWDKYLETYRKIINSVHAVLPYLKQNANQNPTILPFSFDVGILPALTLVANFCRFKVEREMALEIFDQIGEYREGIWDAVVCHQISKWLVRLEEEWRDAAGYIPEARRIDFMSAHIDIGKKTAVLKGWQGDGIRPRVFLREDLVEW